MNIEEIIRKALEEDIGNGDHTSLATIPAEATGKSKLLVKEQGILAGVDIARQVYFLLDPSLGQVIGSGGLPMLFPMPFV